jgi:molecular chaperone GrpE
VADQEWIVGDGETVPARPAPTEPHGPQAVAAEAPGDDEGGVIGSGAPGTVPGTVEDPEELDLVAAQRDEYLSDLRRLQAEFDNYRKRMMRQNDENAQRLADRLIEELLPALDAFDLAMMAVVELPAELATVKKGIELTYAQLVAVLEKAGLEKVDALHAPFDPEVHEAVMQVEEGHEVPVVADVMRAGYRLRGRSLRPAMVKVAK